jgi:hypothetical protein
MRDTAIQAAVPASRPSLPAAVEPAPAIKKPVQGLPYRILQCCASLRVTVLLFALAFFLVFYGTWAQVDASIWNVVKQYFRWWIVFIPVKVLVFRVIDIPEAYVIPYPGGWTLGLLLLINLLAAHATRFRLTWKRSGVLILHAGLILMMLGEFLTGVFAVEGHMSIMESYKGYFVDSDRHYELAVVRRLGPKEDDEIQVPGALLKVGETLKDPELPFDVKVLSYMANSVVVTPREGERNPADAGIGRRRLAVPRSESAGVDPGQEFPSAYVNLLDKTTGASLGTYLVSTWFSFLSVQPDTVTVDGKKYQISLRPQRSYRPYAIHLDKFQHKKYAGTDKDKDFRSFVRLIDPDKAENRQVEIYMNHPLYYRGETFYQASVPGMYTGTILQVVDNWSWWIPYVSFGVVAGGMLIHFGIMLFRFLEVQGLLPGSLALRLPGFARRAEPAQAPKARGRRGRR